MLKLIATASVIVAATAVLSGCEDDAKIASRNVSKAADNFEVNRRLVFLQRHHGQVHADHRRRVLH